MNWRRAKPVLLVLLLGAAGYELFRQRHQLGAGIALLSHPRYPFLIGAAVAQVASVLFLAREEKLFLEPGRAHIGTVQMAELTAAHNAITMSVPGGVAWSTAFLFDQLRRRGADRTLAGWAVLASGAVSSFVLFLILAAAVELTSRGPTVAAKIPMALLASIPLALALVVAALHRRGLRYDDWERWVLDRLKSRPAACRWVEETLGRLRQYRLSALQWIRIFLASLANWGADLLCLVLCIYALDAHVPWPGVILAFVLAKVTGSLPVTPGGIGLVEAGLAGLLVVYGMPSATALGVTLLYRVISFWGLLPIGWGYWAFITLRSGQPGPVTPGGQSRHG